MTAALAHVPASLDELFRMLGDACAVCGEKTVSDEEDGLRVSMRGAVRESVLPVVWKRARGSPRSGASALASRAVAAGNDPRPDGVRPRSYRRTGWRRRRRSTTGSMMRAR